MKNDDSKMVFSGTIHLFKLWLRHCLSLSRRHKTRNLLGSGSRFDNDSHGLTSRKAVDFVRPKAANNSGQWVQLQIDFKKRRSRQ